MKRILGYTFFWTGMGLLMAVLLPNKFVSAIFALAFLLIGYNLFCCK